MNFEKWFSDNAPQIPLHSAQQVLTLHAEGGTIPFIARYRKEATGNLDEVAIEKTIRMKERWDALLKRQATILSEIERQGKLTDELKAKIVTCFSMEILEDLYLPFRQKRRTKAELAREAGLAPLAEWIWACGHGTEQPMAGQTLEIWAFTFRNAEKNFPELEQVLGGASDILIERISETLELRQRVRDTVFSEGALKTEKGEKAKPNSKFESYFSFSEAIPSLLKSENSHRFLALRRGWNENELTLKVASKEPDSSLEDRLLPEFEKFACTVDDSPGAAVLKKAARMALKVHVFPSVENEILKQLKDLADEAAIDVFSKNVRNVLMSPPLGPKSVLGVDPGIRTGCKLAWVDDSGKFLKSEVIYLQTPDQFEGSKAKFLGYLGQNPVSVIAVGNGTHGRETEIFIRKVLKDSGQSIPVVMVSESGASIYSASEVAREEFPDLDLTIRGAISIARRLQDPLAELVKVDPKSIGVGQYQHDVNQGSLKKALDFVVESSVNQVGVNLNTASHSLLAFVSGIGPGLAKNIIQYRGEKGLFKSREELRKVPRFTDRVFEQAAGFLRVPESDNILDHTGVHPERYGALIETAQKHGYSVKDWVGHAGAQKFKSEAKSLAQLVGEFTFNDIAQELEKPGRDIRSSFVPVQFREDLFALKDLQVGMICPGVVTNVTNFGAFVDIGVHQDGLVHISQLSNRFIKDPKECVSVGDRVTVKVIEVNLEKNQIALSVRQAMESTAAPQPSSARPQSSGRPGGPNKALPRSRPPQPQSSGPLPAARSAVPQPRKPIPAPKAAFNNPFGALASLKGQLKK